MHVRVTQQTHYARACVNIHGSRVTIFCGDPAQLFLRRPAWDPTGEHDEGTILHVDSQPSADTPRPPTCFADPSPGDDQGTLEAKRGGRWARAGAGPNPECALTCLARKGKIHSNVRVLAGIRARFS